MPTLNFWGYGDDNFAYSLDGEVDEIGSDFVIYEVAHPDGIGLYVWGIYSAARAVEDYPLPATWMIGVQQRECGAGGAPLPPWPMRFETPVNAVGMADESSVLVIEAPAGVSVRRVIRTCNGRWG